MAVELPRYMALRSKDQDKYLRYIHEDVQVHGFLQFSGDEVVSPYSKFEVETSKNYKGLVHIRCCYNNKYWVRWTDQHWWIIAGANEPNEDKSSWSCTLFEPVSWTGDYRSVGFRHVQLQRYAWLWFIEPPLSGCLFAGGTSFGDNLRSMFTVIDWESLLVLPKYIGFKGDNGQYLSARTIEGHSYLQFASSDISDPTVGNEVFTTPDGSVRIKSQEFLKFWSRSSPNWIWADEYDTADFDTTNSDTLFWPVRVGNNVVALRNIGNNNFCKRLTAEGKTSCLSAAIPTITPEVLLEIGELVLSRNINNVNFRLLDARIYDQSVLEMATQQVTNTSNEPYTRLLKFSYEVPKSHTWKSSVSLKLGVKLIIESGIPFISGGGVEISCEFSGAYEWGETKTKTTTEESLYTVTVPPMTKMTVSRLATQGSCDVPFSYSQGDTLLNGTAVIHDMEDGVFTGVNFYHFKYETQEEKL